MVEELEEFLDTGFNRGELKRIFSQKIQLFAGLVISQELIFFLTMRKTTAKIIHKILFIIMPSLKYMI